MEITLLIMEIMEKSWNCVFKFLWESCKMSHCITNININFGVWRHLGMAECHLPFWGHCALDLDLISRLIVS